MLQIYNMNLQNPNVMRKKIRMKKAKCPMAEDSRTSSLPIAGAIFRNGVKKL